MSAAIGNMGVRVVLGAAHGSAIVVVRDGVVDVISVAGGRVAGWPFVGATSAAPLLVVGIGAPDLHTIERVVTTWQNLAGFDPQRSLG